MKYHYNKYKTYTTNEIEPYGWMKNQLEIQAKGLSGNLDKVWRDIRDSKWIGGKAEGWERVPYWLDGFIPLAYLIKNQDMIARAKKYINAIINRKEEDGWICPCTLNERPKYDVWASMLILKVFKVYYECSNDERIPIICEEILYNLKEHITTYPLSSKPLFNRRWGEYRWYETLITIFWLYELKGYNWLLELAELLADQGINYQELFEQMPYEKRKNKYWTYREHVVNLAMALKAGTLYSKIGDEINEKTVSLMLEKLDKHHGTITGHFSGDECISGKSPIQGTELCGVVEAMYSYEELLAITGSVYFGDRLEILAYNCLPATISADMWTHQYDQMLNQVECSTLKIVGNMFFTPTFMNPFTSNKREAHLYGLEPNFGCCTANFSQGYPKLCLSTFMKAEDGIVSSVIAPSILETSVNGTKVKITLATDFPYGDKLTYSIECDKPLKFAFYIRIPSYLRSATVNSEKVAIGEYYRLEKEFEGKSVINVEFESEFKFVEQYKGLKAVMRPPLVYSVRIDERAEKKEYTRKNIERKFPYCDYEIFPESDFNYALTSTINELQVEKVGDVTALKSDLSPIIVRAKAIKIPWKKSFGILKPLPKNTNSVDGKEYKIELVPYGTTNLRLTALPIIEPKRD